MKYKVHAIPQRAVRSAPRLAPPRRTSGVVGRLQYAGQKS